MAGREQIDQAANLLAEGELDRARHILSRLQPKFPRDAEVHRLLAIAASHAGQLDAAAFYAGRACELAPANPQLRVLHGNALFNLAKGDAALAVFREGLRLDPALTQARAGICEILFQHSRFAEVIAECEAGLKLTPSDGDLRSTLAAALINTGRGEEAHAVMLETARQRPDDPAVASGIAQMTTYLAGLKPSDVLAAHKRFAEVVARHVPVPPRRPIRDPNPARPLRVGFLSGDFRQHSVAFFFEPLLDHLKARHADSIELACYYTTLTDDAVTKRIRAKADLFRDIAQLPIPGMAKAIYDDHIDILVEMSGHTDSSRLAVLQYRPAPVQCTFLGYPATSGLETVDYRIVDSLIDPPGTESHCTEQLARLDPHFLCYRPPAEAPEPQLSPPLLTPEIPSPKPDTPASPITFGSFNVLQKINDPLLLRWKRVLDAVPNSRLLLKNHGLVQAEIREILATRLRRLGFGDDRFELISKQAPMREHLATYHRMDIALDTFPYHGTTTTCDALYMGVPVVTLVGEMHAGRVGLSLLTAVGLEDLAADTEDRFVETAVNLAKDAQRRRHLRTTLRHRLLDSPLCNEPAYADRFAALLRSMWHAACVPTGIRPAT